MIGLIFIVCRTSANVTFFTNNNQMKQGDPRFFPGSCRIKSGELLLSGCGDQELISKIYKHIKHIQVVPGRAGGGSFRRKKTYIAKKEFAYRMCARRPTSAMPKPFLCCEPAFCCSMVVMWPVLMHVMSFDVVVMSFDAMWLLVLRHVTWCNAMSCDVPCNGHVVCSKWFCDNVVIQSTILYYKVLLCTTKYYSSTTLYYKVLLQYYPVLHSTTAVLQSTTPVLLCTTKQHSWLILVTYETSFTMRGATRFILQLHQILRLPRKMNLMIDPRLTWNVI